jgi:hypothetical protein
LGSLLFACAILFWGTVCQAQTNNKERAQQPPFPDKPAKNMRLQIVNATSVPHISLGINGKTYYPDLAAGQWTGHFPWNLSSAVYEVCDLAGGLRKKSPPLRFDDNSSQTLVVMGDFSTDSPPDKLPQAAAPANPEKEYPPNVQFRIYPRTTGGGPRYHFVNAIPRLTIRLTGPGLPPVTPLAPGSDVSTAAGQSPRARYQAAIGETSCPVSIFQRGSGGNILIIFYLKKGKPGYLLIGENT